MSRGAQLGTNLDPRTGVSSMTTFVGRRDELATLDRWLSTGARLMTIAGPPGVGKSRLVRELAAKHVGTVVCDLTSCRSSVDVERAVQGALGGVSRARLARVLATFDRPLVLDRFEHLVEGARDLIASWTAAAGPRIVIASREALGLAGESTLVLEPLGEADAVALYAARARRDVDVLAATSIVRKLDRLPLAIELAAARASVLSDRDLLQRLERGIEAIDSRTSRLRATILWSVDLLTHEERSTLLHCSVFRGAFDGRDAETLARSDDTICDTVSDLVALERKGLLRRAEADSGEARVALYDAVREVALAELAREGRVESVALRHAQYYSQLASGALATNGAANRTLQRSVPDLVAAHAFQRDRDPFAATNLALAIDLALDGQPPSGAHLELLSSAVGFAERANDGLLEARARHARARAERLIGAARHATRDLRVALRLARANRSGRVEADVLRLLGVVSRQLSRPLRARPLLQRALAIYEASGSAEGAARVLDDLGVVAHDLGELTAARELYERALALERMTGDLRFQGITLGHLGLVAHDLEDLAEAEIRYREALVCHRASDDRRFEVFAHAFLAAVMLERADTDAARLSIAAATAIDARLGDIDSGVVLAGIECALHAAAGDILACGERLARARAELAQRDDEALRRVLDVFGTALAVAQARRAREEGRLEEAEARLATAREPGAPPRCVEERLARRVLRHLLGVELGARRSPVVSEDGTWFECGAGRISLATRRALALMLARLAHERRLAPSRSVGIDALFEAGWPGERVSPASARRRVYVGIDTLRSLGLREALVQRDRGYLLDPRVEIAEGEGTADSARRSFLNES